jgi:hypothetical protein
MSGAPDMRQRSLIAEELRRKRELKSTPLAEIHAMRPTPKLSDELRAKLGCAAKDAGPK